MNHPTSSSPGPWSRRRFLATSTALGVSCLASPPRLGAAANRNSKLRILQIGAGGIGSLDRGQISRHPMAEFVGFCDVDEKPLDAVAAQFPGAFKVTDYREAFDRHGDDFDAVVVDTPDFHHAPMILTALKHGKHVYGQKPLVHQLDELRQVREALARRPDLVTQMGNQRASIDGRIKAVHLLRENTLGRPVKAWAWTGAVKESDYFAAPWSPMPPAQPVPDHLHWNLWRGPLPESVAYSPELAPRKWRAFWETGTGQLGDWGCHLLDVLYFAYDLPSPEAVLTTTIRPANTGHSAYNQSTLTYAGGKPTAGKPFVLHYNDHHILPSFASLGLPAIRPGVNQTLIVCEDGVMLLGDLGEIRIYRGGRQVDHFPRPKTDEGRHWRDWVDACLGRKKAGDLWSPFAMGLRITEASLLAVKATRYPGTELRWAGHRYRFTNHEGANRDIVRRVYREGFAPPTL